MKIGRVLCAIGIGGIIGLVWAGAIIESMLGALVVMIIIGVIMMLVSSTRSTIDSLNSEEFSGVLKCPNCGLALSPDCKQCPKCKINIK